ncbi:MAG TPA: hypothetical protein V6D48_03460 [Oculatellaceae cyanobacterium]
MAIRNEVTSRMPFRGSIPGVGANRMLRDGEIGSEANASSNAEDMLTDPR